MEIKPLWKEHPLYKEGKIELVPTEWVWRYRGADVSPGITMGDQEIDIDTLWKDIVAQGLREPFIIRTGLENKKMRLEAGNHRIQAFHTHGVLLVPVIVQIRDVCGPDAPDVMTDATHAFDAQCELLITESTEEYMAPSKVLSSIRQMVDSW